MSKATVSSELGNAIAGMYEQIEADLQASEDIQDLLGMHPAPERSGRLARVVENRLALLLASACVEAKHLIRPKLQARGLTRSSALCCRLAELLRTAESIDEGAMT